MRLYLTLSRILPFLFFMALSGHSGWCQTLNKHMASIVGSVRTAEGEPLAGVTVVLQDGGHGTTTDAEGQFQVQGLAPGSYRLVVCFLGFDTEERAVQLNAAQNVRVDVRLREKTFAIAGVEVVGKSATTQVNEQAYAVTAVSTKELLNSTADTREVLNRVAGVRVLEDGGLGSRASISLNGFSGEQVKFFLDGIPMDNFASSLSLSDIPVNTIERIEVYKGAVPVWLGTDALGGAVNIVTNKKQNYLDASYAIGSFNTHRLSLNGAYTNPANGFTVRGSGNYNYSDNNYKVWVPIVRDANVVDSAEVERFHDRYRSGTLLLEAGWAGRKFADNLLFGVIASGNDQQVQTGATMATVYGGIMRNNMALVPTLKYSKRNLFTKGLDVSLHTALNFSRGEVIDTLSGVRYNWLGEATRTPGSRDGEQLRTFTTLNDTDFNSQLHAGYTLSPKHSLALNYAASHFRREAHDAENPDKIEHKFPKSLSKQVLGLAYKFDPTDRWTTTVSGKLYFLRAETSKEYDFGQETRRIAAFEVGKQNLGYGIASAYFLLPTLQLKASYEHTYRLPLATEIFGDGLFINPNPELGPEQSDNFNAGAAYGINLAQDHQVHLESNFVYRDSRDLIFQNVRVASPVTTYGNLSEVRTLGVEGSMRYQWKQVLHLGGSATYQDITDQADSLYSDYSGWVRNYNKGFRQPNKPYLFANANAGLTFRDLLTPKSVLAVNYYYSFVEQYFLSWAQNGSRNGKLVIPRQSSHSMEVSLSLAGGRYNIAAEARNLTDARLYDKFYLQKPGRAFYLKLRYVL